MNCSQCGFNLGLTNRRCRCGFDMSTETWCRPSTNETYFATQSFGAKRWESLVLHALSYALRDVHIAFQHHVPVELPGRKRFLIDAYFHTIDLAVEVDEDYHGTEAQKADDKLRESEIRRLLGCDFVRIDVWGKPVFPQIDNLVANVRQRLKERAVPTWSRPAPEERASGEFTASNMDKLERAGAFAFMDDFADEVRELGFVVQEGSINGVPSKGNGEAGFILRLDDLVFTVNRRVSPQLRLLLANVATSDALESLGYQTESHQPKPTIDEPRRSKYFSIVGFDKQRHDREGILNILRDIRDKWHMACDAMK